VGADRDLVPSQGSWVSVGPCAERARFIGVPGLQNALWIGPSGSFLPSPNARDHRAHEPKHAPWPQVPHPPHARPVRNSLEGQPAIDIHVRHARRGCETSRSLESGALDRHIDRASHRRHCAWNRVPRPIGPGDVFFFSAEHLRVVLRFVALVCDEVEDLIDRSVDDDLARYLNHGQVFGALIRGESSGLPGARAPLRVHGREVAPEQLASDSA
jgi:hypothetical protein